MGSRVMIGVALAGALLVTGCGEDDAPALPAASVVVGGPGDICHLISQSDAGDILGRSDVQAGVISAEGVCSYSTADGNATLVFDRETRSIFEFALLHSAQLHTAVQPVAGVPDAFYSTAVDTASPGPVSTYLHLRSGSTYYSVVAQKGNKDDTGLEKRVALKLIGRS